MAGKPVAPLCSTCAYHEKTNTKVNFMWAAGWVAVLVAGTAFTLLITGQKDNADKIQLNTERITAHERVMQTSVHDLEQTLTIISINQKRQMQDAGIPYLDPERVHREGM